MTSLQHIEARVAELEAVIIGNGGELPPGSDLERAWNEAQGALIQKVDSYAEYVMHLDAQEAAVEEAIRRLKGKKAAICNHRDRLLKYAAFVMQEKDALEGEAWALRRVKNPPKVEILEEFKVRLAAPECVERVPLEEPYEVTLDKDGGSHVSLLKVSKTKLKELLKDGAHIDGAVLTQGHRIEVK